MKAPKSRLCSGQPVADVSNQRQTLASLTFEQANIDQIDNIIVNELAAYPIPWSIENLKSCLAGDFQFFTTNYQKQIIGHLIYQVILDEIHLLNLCIHPNFQGQAFGRKSLDFLKQQAMKNSARTILLEVRVSNHKAKSLYSKWGFGEIGIRKNYYKNGLLKEDALVMKACL